MKILAVTNIKGGIGKTTTVHNLASVFANFHKPKLRVLGIDMDPQSNYSMAMGTSYPDMMTKGTLDWDRMKGQRSLLEIYADLDEEVPSMARLIFEKIMEKLGSPTGAYDQMLREAIIEHTPNYHYIAGHPLMIYYDLLFESISKNSEEVFADEVNRLSIFSEILSDIANLSASPGHDEPYDLVIVDTNPFPGNLTNNSIMAATDLLIPIAAENFPVIGSILAFHVVLGLVEKGAELNSKSLLITMTNNTNISHDAINGIRDISGTAVLKSMVPRRVATQDALFLRKPAVETDPKNDASVAYVKAAKELWKRMNKA